MRARSRPRAARPADGARCDRADRGTRGGAPPRPRDRPRRAGPARRPPRAIPDDDRRSPRRPARRRPSRRTGRRQLAAWPRPGDGRPVRARLHVGHDRQPEGRDAHPRQRRSRRSRRSTRIIPPLEHRIVSLLPLSHLLEQVVGLYYALDVGADILYVRSRNPRVIFEALRDHRTTSMILVPQVLDLFWSVDRARGREVAADRQLRPPPVDRPATSRTPRGGSSSGSVHSALRRRPPPLRLDRRRSCRRSSSRPGRTSGVIVIQGYGVDRVRVRHLHDPRGPRPRHGGPVRRRRSRCGSRTTARSCSGPERLPRLLARRGGHGGCDHRGRLVPDRRHRPARRRRPAHPDGPEQGHHRAAERLQRVPRGHRERAADRRRPRLGRRRDEARAGSRRSSSRRAPTACRRAATSPPALRIRPRTRRSSATQIDASVKAANQRLAVHQRIAGWRLWPDADFPRTHTLKVKRDVIRAWAAVDEPLPVRQGS